MNTVDMETDITLLNEDAKAIHDLAMHIYESKIDVFHDTAYALTVLAEAQFKKCKELLNTIYNLQEDKSPQNMENIENRMGQLVLKGKTIKMLIEDVIDDSDKEKDWLKLEAANELIDKVIEISKDISSQNVYELSERLKI